MPDFDRIAGAYRWLEYFTFGRALERCRTRQMARMTGARRALVLGDGDGRFAAALLAHNPLVSLVAIDSSAAMLRLLSDRVRRAGAASRLRTVHGEAVCLFADLAKPSSMPLDTPLDPEGGFDLVCSHFFLDCLSTAEVRRLRDGVTPRLSANAVWIVSEFATPTRWTRLVVALLYRGFAVLAGLRTQRLPEWREALDERGFGCVAEQQLLRGLLVSSVWSRGRAQDASVPGGRCVEATGAALHVVTEE